MRHELKQLEKLEEELKRTLKHYKERPVKNTTILRALGSILHDFYSGIEKIFLAIAKEIDRCAPKSENWHRLLLEQMTLPLQGCRPPVISVELAGELSQYLGFRHRFRNLYGFDLLWERMKPLVASMPEVRKRFCREVESFLELVLNADDVEQKGRAAVRYSAEDLAMVRDFLRKKRQEREKELAQRKEAALAAARRAAELIRQRGAKRVWLFGSLAKGGTFGEYSDIDLAAERLPPQESFWGFYAGVMAAAEPFNVDLVLLEEVSPELAKVILTEGREI